MKNAEFKNEFIQRYAWHENTTFKPERLIHFIDSLSSKIAPEIPRHIKKWGGKKDPDFHENWPIKATFNSFQEWSNNVDTMKIFANLRPGFSRAHIVKKFGLTGVSTVTIKSNTAGSGILKVVDRKIPDGFSGKFYNGIPLKLSAVPILGKKFSYWDIMDAKLITTKYYTPDVNIVFTGDTKATAYFETGDLNFTVPIMINEINYKSASDFDTEDWVEIYNSGNVLIDLSGWQLKDSGVNSRFEIPANVTLGAREYMVICKDTTLFAAKFPKVKKRIGNFDFGLSSDGENVTLTDAGGRIIDEVNYSSLNGWPLNANGTGRTIELKNYNLDTNLAASWVDSGYLHGTPGNINSTVTDVKKQGEILPAEFLLGQNYPNPFNPSTQIRFSIKQLETVQLKIHNVLGQVVRTLVNGELNAGEYEVTWNGRNDSGIQVSSGVYIYTLSAGNYHNSKRMVLMK